MSACVTSTANELEPVGILVVSNDSAAAPEPLSGSAVATTSCLTTRSSSGSSEGASPIRVVTSLSEDVAAGCSRPLLDGDRACPLVAIGTGDSNATLDDEADDDVDAVSVASAAVAASGHDGDSSSGEVRDDDDDDDTRGGDRLSPSDTVAAVVVSPCARVAAELVAANSASSSSLASSHSGSLLPGFQERGSEPIVVDDDNGADAAAVGLSSDECRVVVLEAEEEGVMVQIVTDQADGGEVPSAGDSRSSSARFPFSRRVPPDDGPLEEMDDGADSANDSVDIVIEEQYEEFEDEDLEGEESSSVVELNPVEEEEENEDLDDDDGEVDDLELLQVPPAKLPKLAAGGERSEPVPAMASVCRKLFREETVRRNLFRDEAAHAGPSAAGAGCWPGDGLAGRLSESGAEGSSNGSKSLRDKLIMKRKPAADSKDHLLGKKPCLIGSDAEEHASLSLISMADVSEKCSAVVATTSTHNHKKRIPTKENPPPELAPWLSTFQCWSNAERLMALDQLIDMCEPTQVRHMMAVIAPQFQRDFISLLPKELALYVLSFLEPKDLLKAAQTCCYWRVLAEDNLLWREKCKEAGIIESACKVRTTTQKKRPKANPVVSPWKTAYMRQHNIEMNWRFRPIRPPKVLKGHDDHVITCLQFCGTRIVSGSDDNTLKVWSATTGKCLKTLVGHTGGVWSSQMAGSIIVSGSTDRTLKVWNAETGQCVHTLYGHTSTVRCMHLHESKVVSGSRDATLRVWDIESGHCLHVLIGHVAAVRCVQYDGRLVVSGAYDYVVKVWNPEREECLHTLQGHTNRVYSLQFDGVHVVSGSLDTSIRVWDVETGACKHTLMGHQSLTSGMELKNNILVSGNADSTVKVWDITTGQCLQTLSGVHKHNSAVTCLQFNSKFVITSSDDGTVKLWDLKTGEFVRNLVALESGGSGGVVWRIRSSPTKLVCAVGSRNGTEETKLLVLDFDAQSAAVCSADATENDLTTIK